MRATLPFASGGLRELAAIWQADLAQPMEAAARNALSTRLAEVYLQILQTDPDPIERAAVAEHLLALHRTVPLDVRLLEAVADAADEQGDTAVRRSALEHLASHADPEIKARALERLGDVLDQLGERRAAVDSWRPAAQMRESLPRAQAHARRLYERVLDTAPNDREAAERLVELYAQENAWDRVPEVFGVVVRSDPDRAAELLLRLEGDASRAGALDQLAAMVDEALALRAPTSAKARNLRQAKARALAASPSRHAEAAATYRSLLETPSSAPVDDDVRAFTSFIGTLRDPAAQHTERRWLYQWRVEHGDDAAEAWLEWAKSEEAFGARELAVAAYRQAMEHVDHDARGALALRAAALLDELGRPAEAMVVLAPVLARVPRVEAAHAVAREMLGDPRFGVAVANQLESLANGASDPAAARLLAVLVEARAETLAIPDARTRWWRSLAAREAIPVSLDVLLQGVSDVPSERALWDAAERMGRAEGALDEVLRAYAMTVVRCGVEMVEELGRRMVALESECATEAPAVVEALERVLEVAPQTSWALERIKRALAREARWDALFALHDRAIDAAGSDDERAALLDEAAFAARDLAGEPVRAIRYLRPLHALRPRDTNVSTALERLYEREGLKADLIGMLEERAARMEGNARRDLRRRSAALWLELGRPGDAAAIVEAMIGEGVPVADLVGLLERIADCPRQARAVELLYAHYGQAGRIEDKIRIAENALARAEDAAERRTRVRELVALRIEAMRGEPRAFAKVAARVQADVDGDAHVARVAYRALLMHAIGAWRKAGTDAAFEDAAEGAWRALRKLRALLVDAGDARGASRLLERGARLRFEPRRQRLLLQDAVALVEGDDARALRLVTEIFRDESGDAVAASLLTRYAALLDAAGRHEALAQTWEDQARHLGKRGDHDDERACWERAAAAWERLGDAERAIAAYGRGAALGSAASFEALARMHTSRAEWPDATAALEWLCASAPDDGQHVLRLADAYVKVERLDRARACLEDRLATSPPAEEARVLRDRVRGALLDEARSLREAGRTTEAASLLDKAIALDPSDVTLRPQLLELLETLAQWDRVVDVCAQQIALYGEARSKERALIHRRRAHALVHTGRASDALGDLRTAARMLPTHPGILHELGRAAFAADDLELAERSYRSLLLALRSPAEPYEVMGTTQVMVELAAIASQKGEAERAANILESALERAGTVTDRALAVSKLAELWSGPLERSADLGTRIRGHAEAITSELRHAGVAGAAWAALARVHVALGEEDTVLGMSALLSTAVEENPNDAEVFELLAGVLERADRSDALATLLERRLQHVDRNAPDATRLRWRLASALERAGRKEKARVVYESLVDARPLDLDALRMLTERLEVLGSDRLGDALELRIALEPDGAYALVPRLIELRESEWSDAGLARARDLLDGAIADHPGDPALRCLRARMREEAGDLAGAVSDLRDLGGAPCAGEAVGILERIVAVAGDADRAAYGLVLTDLLVAARRTARAREVVEDIVARDPDHAEALERVASLAFADGDWDRAIVAYARLAPMARDAAALARVAVALTDACERAGRAADAREVLERARASSPESDAIALRLERVYEATSSYALLADLLVVRAERADAAEKASLLVRAASALLKGDATHPRALPLLDRARSLDPAHIEAALASATILMALERPRDASTLLTDIVERHRSKRSPLLAAVHLALAKAQLALDELAEAFDALKTAFALDARSADIALLLGLVAIDLGEERTAERALLAVAMLQPRASATDATSSDKAKALVHLAKLAHAKGDMMKARSWAGKALALAPEQREAAALLARCEPPMSSRSGCA